MNQQKFTVTTQWPTMCNDCKGRIIIKTTLVKKTEQEEETKTDTSTSINPTELIQAVKSMAKKKHSVDEIKYGLLAQYPQYEKYIINSVIATILKVEYNVIKKLPPLYPSLPYMSSTIKIERDYSVFVGESELSLKSTVPDQPPIQTWILCAISIKGIYKLDISVGGTTRPCSQAFIKAVYKDLQQRSKSKTFQIVVKPSMPDISEVEKLFHRYSDHTLCYYPSVHKKYNPARRYLRKLIHYVPKQYQWDVNDDYQDQVEVVFRAAVAKVTKRDCKRWIDRYLHYI